MTADLFSIAGKRTLITGGTSGIGYMLVEGFAERGARVYTCSRKEAAVAATVEELAKKRGLAVAGQSADLSTIEDVARIAEAASEHFGGEIDVLINNAGATWGASIDTFPETGWDRVFDLNVKALFFLTQKCLPALRKAARGNEQPATVINIGSISGIQFPRDDGWSYHPAKAAVHHLTQTMAKALSRDCVTVNAIAPGVFPSKMTKFMMPDGTDSMIKQAIPLGRAGRKEDIVGTAIYLASRAGAFTTGAVIKVDGGSALV